MKRTLSIIALLSLQTAIIPALASAETGFDGSLTVSYETSPHYDDDNAVTARGSIMGGFGGNIGYQVDLGFTNQFQDGELGNSTIFHLITPVSETFTVGAFVGAGQVDEDGYFYSGLEFSTQIGRVEVEGFLASEVYEDDPDDKEPYYAVQASHSFGGSVDLTIGYLSWGDDEKYAQVGASFALGNAHEVAVSYLKELGEDPNLIQISLTKTFGNGAKFMDPSREAVFGDL